ncbi:hypothetical protein EY643_03785 [Halioglobus maricola]|uniref:Pilus assembly protein PilW n=1 Tax=Halioglobus maricola TaxID=2601894 RepID=A0A5P9NH23_9GAMM|nr:PilW family protein [Halioglobus maricola]QFU74835.1 hypothetical protein EY643_03785 [Halioglobus maricola]
MGLAGRACSGIGLIELMISLALGALLSLGVAGLIVKAQRHYWHDEQLAQLRDNGRYALNLLRRELSMAGFFGYSLPQELEVDVEASDACYAHLLGPLPSIEHYDDLDQDGVSGALAGVPEPCRRQNYYQPGSDALLIRRVLDSPLRLRGETLKTAMDTAVYLQGEGGDARLAVGPGSAAILWRYSPYLWFVRNYSVVNGDGIPGLCRLRLSPNGARLAPVECLAEGVEMLQLEFALDTNGDMKADQWTSRPTASQLPQALLVRIRLSMRSVLPLSFSGGYLRHNMAAIVLLRNSDVLRS